MKHQFYLLLVILLISKTSVSQINQPNQCNCLDNLNILISKTEENYAGYPSKVGKNSILTYKKLIKQLKLKAKMEDNPKTCFFILRDYVRFFRDKHFILSYNNENDYNLEIIKISEDTFKKELANRKLNNFEGIWINADSSLKLAIKKFQNNLFKAIVLQSNNDKIPVGLVYATFQVNKNKTIVKEYNTFITTDIPAKVKGNLLQIGFLSMFGKIYPNTISIPEQQELSTWENNNYGLNFKKLSPKTAYLKIPTFQNNQDKIQQLVIKNDSIIKKSENLIVDLTGNAGGESGWVPILPYFMTNTIYQYDTYLRVTPENVKSKLADLETYVLNPIPNEYKKYFPDKTLAAYKKAYKELPTTKKQFYPIPGVSFPLDSVLKNPKKIALVVDDFCGSSTEYFFNLTKQSKKTKTYGVNTIGMMDYEGMSTLTKLPYPNFYLTIPIVKSSWTDKSPIDKTGFKPDIILDISEQHKWIESIRKDLEK